MANTKSFQHVRTTTESVTIKGLLSDDCSKITYVVKEEEHVANIKEYLEKFAGEEVEFKIGIKSSQDMMANDD